MHTTVMISIPSTMVASIISSATVPMSDSSCGQAKRCAATPKTVFNWGTQKAALASCRVRYRVGGIARRPAADVLALLIRIISRECLPRRRSTSASCLYATRIRRRRSVDCVCPIGGDAITVGTARSAVIRGDEFSRGDLPQLLRVMIMVDSEGAGVGKCAL